MLTQSIEAVQLHRSGAGIVSIPVADYPPLVERLQCLINHEARLCEVGDESALRPESALGRVGAIFGRSERRRAVAPRVLLTPVHVHLGDRAIAVTPSLAAELSGFAETVTFEARIRNVRKLCAHLYALLDRAPDVVVLGGMQDFAARAGREMPAVDLDEFRHRLGWCLEVLRCHFRVGVVLAWSPRVESVGSATPYRACVDELAGELGVTVVDFVDLGKEAGSTPDGPLREAATARLAEAIRAVARVGRRAPAGADAVPSTTHQYDVADQAEIVLGDSDRVRVNGPRAEALDLACSALVDLAERKEHDLVPKRLEHPGGRNEMERALQKRIIDWLHGRERPAHKRCLVLGDSIRMRLVNATGFGLHAYRRLVDRVNLTHVPHNCGGTKMYREFLDNWLQSRPDIVYVNTGLHDLAFSLRTDEPPRAWNPIDRYAANLEWIITRFEQSGVDVVIWGLNTPVHEEWHTKDAKGRVRKLGRRNEDVEAYNEASLEVMRRHGIEVVDAYTPLREAGVDRVLVEDGVHLNRQGSMLLGTLVADAVAAVL